MCPERTDPQRAVRALSERGVRLELDTLELCFLAALKLRTAHTQLAAFTEEQLVEAFDEVAALVPSDTGASRRATPLLRRLREQRLLSRVDGSGLLRAGEYSLTRLAAAVVEFFLEEESLTRESLTLLTRSLIASLGAVLAAAQKKSTESSAEDWQAEVVGPLRVTVAELLSGIEKRQLGFDLEQELLQKEIGALITSDWFGAVDRCQTLLDTTSRTLRELNQVLLRDTHEIQALLQDIQELAASAGQPLAEAASRTVVDHIDRITAWGGARQRAWSEYYQYVHRYVRDVVRLDPSRTLVQRLRDQLAGRAGKPYALSIAAAPPIRLLRPLEAPGERPPVRRPRRERDSELAESQAVDPEAEMERRVSDALSLGARDLATVTAHVTAELPETERFAATGRVAHTVARVCRPAVSTERPWVAVGADLVIEDWEPLEAVKAR